jgi:outer membrane murein-binding lipoprotein Lpp
LGVILKGQVLAHNALSLGAATAQTVPQLQTKLRRLASAEDRIGDDLSALKPPKDAVAANAELAKGEHYDAAELRRLIPKLSKFSSPRQALHFLNRVGHTKGGREQDEAIAKLKKLGYTTGTQSS